MHYGQKISDHYFLSSWNGKNAIFSYIGLVLCKIFPHFKKSQVLKMAAFKNFFCPLCNWKKKIRSTLKKHRGFMNEKSIRRCVHYCLTFETIILSPFSPSVLDEIWIFNILLDNIIIIRVPPVTTLFRNERFMLDEMT